MMEDLMMVEPGIVRPDDDKPGMAGISGTGPMTARRSIPRGHGSTGLRVSVCAGIIAVIAGCASASTPATPVGGAAGTEASPAQVGAGSSAPASASAGSPAARSPSAGSSAAVSPAAGTAGPSAVASSPAAAASPGAAAASPGAATASPGAAASSGPSAGSPEPAGPAALPARITAGTCDAPQEELVALLGLVANPEGQDQPERPVFISISELDGGLDALLEQGGVLVVGGDPASVESAVACGVLDGQLQAPGVLAIELGARLDSGYWGTALLQETDGAVAVTIVLTSPASPMDRGEPAASAPPDGSAGGSAPPGASGDPAASASVAPRPSVVPGTSGAPPFSPLPAGSSAP